MYSIITELEEQAAVQVMHIWRQLHEACGLEGIFNYPNPHFTWFGAEEFDIDPCSSILNMVARATTPFSVHTNGLGVFPGEEPVLYLPLVKSAHIMDLHEFWVPHITLAIQDLRRENLSCAIDSVGFTPVEIFTIVDHFLIVKSDGSKTGDTLKRFRFSGLELD